MRRKLMDNKGVTLVEVLVTIAILGIIITPVFSMFITAAKANASSDEKMKATFVAQEVMENIKATSDITSITSPQYIGDYEITVGLKETDYKFNDSWKGSGTEIIQYDIRLVLNESNQIELYRMGDISPVFTDIDNSIDLVYEDDKISVKYGVIDTNVSVVATPDVKVELFGDNNSPATIYLNAKNNESSDTLIVYLVKSSETEADYSFHNQGGNIRVFKNVFHEEEDSQLNQARVYRVDIIVKNLKGDTIEEITGYKTFLK